MATPNAENNSCPLPEQYVLYVTFLSFQIHYHFNMFYSFMSAHFLLFHFALKSL